jgi:hypothetical protein
MRHATGHLPGEHGSPSKPNEPARSRARRTGETIAEECPMSPSALRLLATAGCVAATLFGPGLTVSLAADDPASIEPSAKQCIADLDSGYSDDAGKYFYTMNFQNNCDKPIICTIDAYITSFRGPISAHTILHFPAKAQTPAQKSYAVRVNAMSGTVQYGRACNFL